MDSEYEEMVLSGQLMRAKIAERYQDKLNQPILTYDLKRVRVGRSSAGARKCSFTGYEFFSPLLNWPLAPRKAEP